MKKLILLSATLFIAACSSESGNAPKPGSDNNNKAESAGPYSVSFDNANNYTHTFTMPINQDEGVVDYYITTPTARVIEFIDTNVKVTGCDASAVKHFVAWVPDMSKPTTGYEVVPKRKFTTVAGTQGGLRNSLKGLQGCATIEMTLSLKLIPPTVKACAESTDKNCRVDVYCKEKGNFSTYAEVEVWKESWGSLTLRHFMKSSDGTRGQILMTTATQSNETTKAKYVGSNATLSIDKATGSGVLTEVFSGHTMTVDLNCQILN